MTRTTKTRTHARSWYALLASAASLAAAACSDSTSTSPLERSANAALSASLATLPAGYGNLTSSYVDSAARDSAVWCGGGREARFAGGSLMGGGSAMRSSAASAADASATTARSAADSDAPTRPSRPRRVA